MPSNLHTTHAPDHFNWVWDAASDDWVKEPFVENALQDGGFVLASIQPNEGTGTLQTAATANGNGSAAFLGTANSVLVLWVSIAGGVLGGTTVNFEITPDNGVTWAPVQAHRVGTNTIATSTSVPGATAWELPGLGLAGFRTPITNYGTGTVNVTYRNYAGVVYSAPVYNANVVTYTSALEFDASNNPIYIGSAVQGTAKSAAAWQIRKLTFDVSGNPTDVQFAGGSADFTAIWNNRAALTYS